LGQNVFVRVSHGVVLSEMGQRLLELVRSRKVLEEEFMASLHQKSRGDFTGVIRIAGYSTILNHAVAPVLAPFLRKNPDVQLHFTATQGIRPLDHLYTLVQRSEVDFLITSQKFGRPDLVSTTLGLEELVAVQSKTFTERNATFLDTRPEEHSTQDFLA